ncbi:hypothetical protein BDQ17DRAFT_1455771 [Cyathus striatus]|nr:hypothetical protein BDQ17DRAFT_1455771 [Cyathus striatus]
MIMYLLLYFVFRNAPLDPVDAFPIQNMTSTHHTFPVSVATPNSTFIDSASVCSCNQCSVLEIVWSCIATLFLCTWSSVHPNMPAPRNEWWKILWRRLKMMCWALMALELILT